jgi:hypothetical protein
MKAHWHLGKLARLTRGAALIGIGASALGCSKTDVPAQPHGSSSSSADEPSDDGGSADASRRRLLVPNAIPKYLARRADAAGTNDGGDASP